MRIRWMASVVVSLFALQGCGDSTTVLAKRGDGGTAEGCTKDTDCKGDRICVEGECVSPSGSGGGANAGGSAGSGGRSTGTGGASAAGAGGSSAGGGADSGSPGGAGNGGASNGGASNGGASNGGASNGGVSGGGAGGSPPGPECTDQDTSACRQTPLGRCCTQDGTCGFPYPLFGCIPIGTGPDGGTGTGGRPPGAGGSTPGGTLVNAACKTCRAASCSTQAAACNANAACAALSACIDNASPFTILNCLTGVTPQAQTLYRALSTCASTNCTSAPCPNINI